MDIKMPSNWNNRTIHTLSERQVKFIKAGKPVNLMIKGQWLTLNQRDKKTEERIKLQKKLKELQEKIARLV